MLISLTEIIRSYQLKIKGVIHIGAHYGQEYADYKANGIKNMMFFEPLSDNFDRLIENIGNSPAYNIALGNTTGEIDMFVESSNSGMSSSILEPDLHLKQYPFIKFDKKETVKIDLLDNIQFNREEYNMINIDVQGYELEVFRGSTETLKSIEIIYTEVNRGEVYKNCAKVDQVDEFLRTFNFQRVQTAWDGKTWGDALYLKL